MRPYQTVIGPPWRRTPAARVAGVWPKPMLIISGTRDEIFPIAATRGAYRKPAQVYELLARTWNATSTVRAPGIVARRYLSPQTLGPAGVIRSLDAGLVIGLSQ